MSSEVWRGFSHGLGKLEWEKGPLEEAPSSCCSLVSRRRRRRRSNGLRRGGACWEREKRAAGKQASKPKTNLVPQQADGNEDVSREKEKKEKKKQAARGRNRASGETAKECGEVVECRKTRQMAQQLHALHAPGAPTKAGPVAVNGNHIAMCLELEELILAASFHSD